MAKQRISKTVFDKENFDKVIDRSFKEYLKQYLIKKILIK